MSDKKVDKMRNEKFVEYFIDKHRPLIRMIGRKYLIPNRYSVEDLEHSVAERILTILKNRKDNPDPSKKILDREKYFLGCLTFYCIEYQRSNGFVFGLPRRPRKNALGDEKEAKSKGFMYFGDGSTAPEDDSSLVYEEDSEYDPGEKSTLWHSLTGHLQDKGAAVIDCIFSRGMTLAETAKHLGVAQSTCLNRRDRAKEVIYRHFEGLSGTISENLVKAFRDRT